MMRLTIAGLFLIFAGMLIVILGSLIYSSQTSFSFGGFVLIGPIPVLFGGGRYGLILSLISLVLGILMVLLTYIYVKRLRSQKSVSP